MESYGTIDERAAAPSILPVGAQLYCVRIGLWSPLPARTETVYARQVLLQGDVQKPAAPSSSADAAYEPGRRHMLRGRLRVACVLFLRLS